MNGWKRRWMRLARDKVLSLISLATKAGRCASGEFMTEGQTKSGRASLVVVAEDASDNTKKKFRDMCKFYKVPMIVYGDKDTLGHAMGKEFRASLAILDEGFAKGIRKQLEIKNKPIRKTERNRTFLYISYTIKVITQPQVPVIDIDFDLQCSSNKHPI